MKHKRFTFVTVFQHFIMIVFSLLAMFPLYWMIISSFKNESEIFTSSLIPMVPTFQNYIYAFQEMPILRMMLNSFVVAILLTALQLVTSILTSYALVRWQVKGATIIYTILSLSWLIPMQVIMIPNYVLINQLGLNETLIGIVIPLSVSTFAILSLYQSFRSFPQALIESARLDGEKDFFILVKIILPNIKSTVASLGILLFISGWNEYLWPMLITTEMENSPIQIGLRSFVNSDVNMWGSLMAATTISCLPILLIYFLLRKHIIESFVRYGIK
ncbi:carbohydrate ABC transporter permease [Gracilibacillus caseinilyticus]|uniref:Carbohydrate ABC transporter permease n=1 Tax=Gracilibacillus caseinilyticus TaxID=2932256 RepID=A0ABY4EXA5_9BACI|nr:carbohydrate ABC transporter permease [Gracilibacillus caseinilyticus]UOQ49041.1 carbohydrate ABC transporter permease [Gracilibacillus caseinilyticus]